MHLLAPRACIPHLKIPMQPPPPTSQIPIDPKMLPFPSHDPPIITAYRGASPPSCFNPFGPPSIHHLINPTRNLDCHRRPMQIANPRRCCLLLKRRLHQHRPAQPNRPSQPMGAIFTPSHSPSAFTIGINQRFQTIRILRLCLLYTSPSPRDATLSRMPSSA